jgi:dihydrofolate reductase
MRNVILQEFISLDSLAAGQNDSVDFVPASTRGDQRFGREQLLLMDSIDTILLGRVTYRLFSEYWPKVTEGDDHRFAGKLNAIPKVVFSRTLDRAPWGDWPEARVVKRSAADEVQELKSQPGKSLIVWGSISLAQSLMKARLIDEYRLVICPFVLGRGRPLFADDEVIRRLKFVSSTAWDLGAVSLKYLEA